MKLRALLALLLFSAGLNAAPKVAVSLKPLHSLVANVMQGVATPDLLLPDGASPHTFQLKPSTLRTLQQADLIIWVGPELEIFMSKAIKETHPKMGTIAVLNIPTLHRLPQRHGRLWQHDEHNHQHGEIDPHVWLSCENAKIFVAYFTDFISKADPINKTQYQNNAQKLQRELNQLKTHLHTMLTPVQKVPFLVYHDGYQYFDEEFHLNNIGAVNINPHLPLSANGLNTIKHLIKEQNIHCVFRDIEFNDKLTSQLQDASITLSALDPLGAKIPAGPENYLLTLKQLGEKMHACLAQG